MIRKTSRAGFTLIELSLAIVFVGILSMAVVLMVNNTIASYRRGMTLNKINTAGMDLVDDMRSAVVNSSADAVSGLCTTFYDNDSEARRRCMDDGAYNFVSLTWKAQVLIGGEPIGVLPVFGAFCTGTYSYIWASGYFDNSKVDGDSNKREVKADRPILRYRNALNQVAVYGDADDEHFRILKVRDDTRAVCVSKVRPYSAVTGYSTNYYYAAVDSAEEKNNVFYIDSGVNAGEKANEFNITNGYGMVTEEPVDLLLSDQENDLVLYDLAVPRPAESTTQQNMFYSASFILGTIRGGINILANGQSCEPPQNYEKEAFDYCAINKFNFAVQAGGE